METTLKSTNIVQENRLERFFKLQLWAFATLSSIFAAFTFLYFGIAIAFGNPVLALLQSVIPLVISVYALKSWPLHPLRAKILHGSLLIGAIAIVINIFVTTYQFDRARMNAEFARSELFNNGSHPGLAAVIALCLLLLIITIVAKPATQRS